MLTYNRLDLTEETLNSFFQTTTSKYRLIIVDNGSKDGTVEYLNNLRPPSEWCVGCEILLNPENKGNAYGRNQALQIANKFNDPFLSTMDNDVIFPDGWLNEILDIINANPNFVIGVNMEPTPYPLITLNKKTFQYKAKGNLGTASTVFKRELHNKIGFFQIYSLFGEEDADFHFRSRLAGYQMGYLANMGTHLGQNERDTGAYREF